MEAAGIAPAIEFPQVAMQHKSCADTQAGCLHTVCTDLALRELVAKWLSLAPSVRTKIIGLMRESEASSQAPEVGQ